jgi:hypothetical protein
MAATRHCMRHRGPACAFAIAMGAIAAASSCARPVAQWTPVPPFSTPKEFDLTFTKTDYNGSPLNPRWGAHAAGLGLPPIKDECRRTPNRSACTTQATSVDLAQGLNLAVCTFDPSEIKGHVNWAVAASTGRVLWLNSATDGDYNLMFFPDDDAALTSNNMLSGPVVSPERRFVELEFDSRETVAGFTTSFWTDLHKTVTANATDTEINEKLNPTRKGEPANAVVYGLLGLDCEHDCASEYHPVYAIAIEIDPTPSNNQWAIFARNWGNEGFCSRYNHELTLPDGRLRLTLPRLGGGPTVVHALSELASTNDRVNFPSVEFDSVSSGGPDVGNVVLTFELPPPGEKVAAEMLLTLQWESTPPPPPPPTRVSTGAPSGAPRAERTREENTAEARLADALAGLKAKGPMPAASQGSQPKATTPKKDLKPVTIAPFKRPTPGAARPPTARLQVDSAKLARDKALLRAVCDSPDAKKAIPERDLAHVCAEARR